VTNLIAQKLTFYETLSLASTCKALFNILSFRNKIWTRFFKGQTKIYQIKESSNLDFDCDDGPDGMSWKEVLMNKINCKVEVICVLSEKTMQKIYEKNFIVEKMDINKQETVNPHRIYPYPFLEPLIRHKEDFNLYPKPNTMVEETLEPLNTQYHQIKNEHQHIEKVNANLLALSDHQVSIKDEEKKPSIPTKVFPSTDHALNMTIELPEALEQIECLIVVVTIGTDCHFQKINYNPKIYTRPNTFLCD
jgi:hypothetical protein